MDLTIPDDLSIPEFLRRPKPTPQALGKLKAKYKDYRATAMPPDTRKIEFYDGHPLPHNTDASTRAFIAQLEAAANAKAKAAEAVRREEQVIRDRQKEALRAVKARAREVAKAAKAEARTKEKAAKAAAKVAKATAKAAKAK